MKLIVGYKHGTNQAENLLELALKRAQLFNATVLIVTVMSEGMEKDQDLITEAEDALEKAKTHFDRKDIPCETHLLIRGIDSGDDLVNFAKETQADEIIIGVKNRTKVGKLLLGSTAQAVVLNAPCPVVTMK
ncbi:MAG: universal stress protein [Desulfobacter sp.]|jgi:nucleotide-binding universal stress UspA family protein|uniref:universal stress protein n=1 Tax=uncultured Desulfobacter sp. TaxID=240139 RepID=UPI0029C7966F|nr:universal stress protein [uncultured Desulfobacter sp.]MCW8800943.1 universal stress protein [Desulfobacter sp.]